nr:hypothetical protein [Pseudomonas sp. GM74]
MDLRLHTVSVLPHSPGIEALIQLFAMVDPELRINRPGTVKTKTKHNTPPPFPDIRKGKRQIFSQ